MLTKHGVDVQMPRALLTDGERAAIRDEPGLDSATKSTHLSRVRSKMDRMTDDAQLLREHRPEMYESLREAVVEQEIDDRLASLEREVAELREERGE